MERKCNRTLHTYWLETNYLTPQWWLIIFLCIISPVIWFKFVDKKRITEITLFGLFYGITAIILDAIGSFNLAWFYPYRLTPFLYPELYPYDICVVIIPFMFAFQRWRNDLKKFTFFTLFLSAGLSFLAEPFMEWIKIYREVSWKNIYSFPIYWIVGNICWLIITKFKKLEQRQY